ncbi:MAG: magnesium-translocating P-type ATPase [Patescibacteria group bacterium]
MEEKINKISNGVDNQKQNLDYFFKNRIEDIYSFLQSSSNGLKAEEVEARLLNYGYNVIKREKKLSLAVEFLSHFKNPLVIILLFVSAVSAYFGETTNAVIVIIMVLASVILDFFEEHSANDASKKLREKVSITATVLRDGEAKEIKTKKLVPGDVVLLNSGDLIPADCRIIEANDFFVNQSSLTGESFPLEKAAGVPANEEAALGEIENIAFMGSNVVSGTAKAIIFSTGSQTQFGKIAGSLSKKEAKSEFEVGVVSFGYFIMKVIIFLVLLIFFFNALVGRDIIEVFIFSLAIAVGVTPELLPMIMSITMARGSVKMAKDGVIVKKLSSIPGFGSMDILCTDKTGTLTEDKIKLIKYTDTIGKTNEDVFLYTFLNSFYQTGVENPLDKAVLEFRKTNCEEFKKIDEIPFDFIRKMMSIIVEGKKGQRYLITKGAPENIFLICNNFKNGSKNEKFTGKAVSKATEYYKNMSAAGYRVLAVAIKELPKDSDKRELSNIDKYSKSDESSMTLIGFVSFLDPAKEDVREVLRELEAMGVEIKIITGDNELVAQKICRDVGLNVRGILLGSELDNLTDDALAKKAEATTLFAKFSPDEKNRVIVALRSRHHVVGYMGDGINDAPSIRAADVGISVNNAVDIARESADFILTQKNLRSLVDGIIQGRRSFGNTMKYIMMGLSSNFGNMFSVVGAIFYLPFLPMLPIQILLNNFIYDLSQVTIPTDKVDKEWIKLPRRWDISFVKKFMLTFGPISSLFDFITFFILFSVFKLSAPEFQTGWFLESLATQTLVIHIIRTRKLPFFQSRASALLFLSTFACVAIGWLIPYTALGRFFQFAQLPFHILAVIAVLVLIYLVLVEIVKRIFYRKFAQ